ncbi:MAG: hypothetical protein K1X68_00700 [Saprospiraceae bacterium]|nr:hypothetical protein [Saprospiraceae bacterium]HMW40378.1 hypothetical protein [Saprospiraceae bacterium]HMX89004.1 hypothetical protein [Saprospiraceae bacterium]HMZ40100.1 hypothetical protein [Saprospiraceae bacterium]HNA65491.1 hypothetical protein [Saprospiraceae bacterium]
MKKKQTLLPYLSLFAILLLYTTCKEDDTVVTEYKDFSIYLTFDSLPHAPLDISKSVLQKKLIKYQDIKSYDSANTTLELRYRADSLFNWPSGNDNRGFVAVANDSIRIYGGYLWSPLHSSTNDNIVLTLPLESNASPYHLRVQNGYPFASNDPAHRSIINAPQLMELFRKDGKLR